MKRFALCAALVACCGVTAFAWESDDYGFPVEGYGNQTSANKSTARTGGLLDRMQRRRRAQNTQNTRYVPANAAIVNSGQSIIEVAPEQK